MPCFGALLDTCALVKKEAMYFSVSLNWRRKLEFRIVMCSNPVTPALLCSLSLCNVARTTTHCNKLLVALLCCNVLWFVCGVHMKRHTHNNYALVIIGYRKSGTCNISQEQHTVNLVLFAISHTLGVSFLKVYSKAEGEGMMDIAN